MKAIKFVVNAQTGEEIYEEFDVVEPNFDPNPLKDSLVEQMKKNVELVVYEIYPDYKQRSAMLGLYDQSFVDEMKTYISKAISYATVLYEEIMATTDKAGWDIIVEKTSIGSVRSFLAQ